MSLSEKIKVLRTQTGLPIMDCKKALIEANEDLIKAKLILVEYSIIKAKKLLTREIKVKKIFAYTHNNGKIGILLKLGTETDFVINNNLISLMVSSLFLNLVEYIFNKNNNNFSINIESFLESINIIDGQKKVKDLLLETMGILGENITILDIKFLIS